MPFYQALELMLGQRMQRPKHRIVCGFLPALLSARQQLRVHVRLPKIGHFSLSSLSQRYPYLDPSTHLFCPDFVHDTA